MGFTWKLKSITCGKFFSASSISVGLVLPQLETPIMVIINPVAIIRDFIKINSFKKPTPSPSKEGNLILLATIFFTFKAHWVNNKSVVFGQKRDQLFGGEKVLPIHIV